MQRSLKLTRPPSLKIHMNKQFLGYFLGFAIFIAGVPALMWLVAGMPSPANLPVARLYLAILIALAGLAISIWSIVYMRRVGKGNPFDAMGHEVAPRTRHLMTDGPYRLSRNPMLSGTYLYYIGVLVALWNWWALLVFAAVATAMMFQVRSEEKRLEADFGQEYLDYKKRTGRFLMKPFILCIALLLTACNPFRPFTFVQMSDPQIGFIDESPSYVRSDSLMKAAVDAVNALRPACVIVTGDLVNDPADSLQNAIYQSRISEIEAPVYVSLGNHDYRGYDRFSFRESGCAFIGMDSNCIKDGAADVEAGQLEWLKKELSAAKGCRYTFVFLHCPVIRESIDEPEDYFNFSKEKRREYIDLFKEYGVDIVFAGHTHQEYECACEGIRFVAAGPVGNALGRGTPGYNVVQVGEKGVEVTYTPTS